MNTKSKKRSAGSSAASKRMDRATVKSAKPVKLYDGVFFHFLTSDEESTLKGTVLIRLNEMVLDINDPGGASPYLIVGYNEGKFFRGDNTAHDSSVCVGAKWSDFGDQFLGIWTEDGTDYYFSFRLPQSGS
jgi:hypothetical protein